MVMSGWIEGDPILTSQRCILSPYLLNDRTTVTVWMDQTNQVPHSRSATDQRNLGVSQWTILLCQLRSCPRLHPLLPRQRRSLRPTMLRWFRRIQRPNQMPQHMQRTRRRSTQTIRRTSQTKYARLASATILHRQSCA